MAEEATTVSPSVIAKSSMSPAPEPKKRRGPRAKNQSSGAASHSATGAAVSNPQTVASPRVKKAKADTSETKASMKQPRKPRKSKAAAAAHSAAVSGDEFADLLQLEEENRTLRKQLAEKLRSENEDLRRRLGHL